MVVLQGSSNTLCRIWRFMKFNDFIQDMKNHENPVILVEVGWLRIFSSKSNRSKPISKEEAIAIVMQQCIQPKDFRVIDSDDHTPNIYNAPQEPCWYIYPPSFDPSGHVGGDSRVIAISKLTGKVLYDGVELSEWYFTASALLSSPFFLSPTIIRSL